MAMTASSSDSSNLAERLLRNDPELEHLYLSSDSLSPSNVIDLVEVLASGRSTVLEHVYFRNFKLSGGGGDGPTTATSTMGRLLEAVCHTPNLQGIHFHCTEVPLALLGEVLTATTRSSRNLTCLGMRYCKLKFQNEQECVVFERTLRRHSSLQDVCVECCEWQQVEGHHNDHHDNNANNFSLVKMNSFLQAASSIPTLQHVECVLAAANTTIAATRQRLSRTTLQRLCRAPLLTTLRLRNVWIPQFDVVILCHSLQQQTKLEKLILSCDFGPTAALALAHYLQQGAPSLHHLALRLDDLKDPHSPQILAQALQSNQHVRHFHLSGQAAPQLSPIAKAAFCDMMQTNTTLEFVRLDVSDYELQSQVAFHLQLNHKGRRALLEGLHSAAQQRRKKSNEARLWVDALCQNATCLRSLHYFLSLHPSIYAMAALDAEEAQQDNLQSSDNTSVPPLWISEDGIDYDSDGW